MSIRRLRRHYRRAARLVMKSLVNWTNVLLIRTLLCACFGKIVIDTHIIVLTVKQMCQKGTAIIYHHFLLTFEFQMFQIINITLIYSRNPMKQVYCCCTNPCSKLKTFLINIQRIQFKNTQYSRQKALPCPQIILLS